MTEHQVGEILLERVRIPGILAALFVAMAVHYTPLGERLLTPEFQYR